MLDQPAAYCGLISALICTIGGFILNQGVTRTELDPDMFIRGNTKWTKKSIIDYNLKKEDTLFYIIYLDCADATSETFMRNLSGTIEVSECSET